MAITQEEFDALIEKLEDFSRKHPRGYRLRVALFAILGYAYIFLVLAGLLVLVGLTILLIIFGHHISSTLSILKGRKGSKIRKALFNFS
jgi:hypothetical protein